VLDRALARLGARRTPGDNPRQSSPDLPRFPLGGDVRSPQKFESSRNFAAGPRLLLETPLFPEIRGQPIADGSVAPVKSNGRSG